MSQETEVFVFPASHAQRGQWLVQRLDPTSGAYNIPFALKLSGPLDAGALERGLEELVHRHESLRTRFEEQDGELMQVIHPPTPLTLEQVDLSGLEPEARAERLRALCTAEATRPFDLAGEPLLRTALYRLGPTEHVLLGVLHHAIADGESLGVFSRELVRLYEAFSAGRPSPLPEPELQYVDYSEWHHEWLASEEAAAQLSWWRERLAHPPVLELPGDRPRPAVRSLQGASLDFHLTPAQVAPLRALGQQEGATLFMAGLAAFKALLHRVSGAEDLVVGTPIAGRSRPETQGLIGCLVNSLALRSTVTGGMTWRELVRQVRAGTLDAYARQDVPFDRVVEALRLPRNTSHTPVFQVFFALERESLGEARLGAMHVAPLSLDTGVSKFELILQLTEHGGGLRGHLEYSTDLFDAPTARRLVRHFERMVDAARHPDLPLGAVELLDEQERARLEEWNRTASDFPREATLAETFRLQATRTPEAPALVFPDGTLTYAELETRSNRLARYLASLGVGPEVCVGLHLEPSAELVVAMLAVLKAGGAYVPLDLSYPTPRLDFMVEDAGIRVVLTQERLEPELMLDDGLMVFLDTHAARVSAHPGTPLEERASAHGLAYVIYTSGSTGKPKGVCVTHQAIHRLALNTNYVKLGPGDRVAQVSNPAFDAATFEIWGALLTGATVVGIDKDTLLSSERFVAALREQRITSMFLTTARFNRLVHEVPGAFRTLREVLVGGEACDPAALRAALVDGPRRLLHVYGPTEVTTFATWHEVTSVPPGARTVSIGRPLANTRVHILDAHLRPLPPGRPGELYLGGEGVARGYLSRPELTAERFVPDPFSAEPGARLYRTGDVGRFLADGAVEFIGRVDHQVKLRGFRIELGEVEAALRQHPAVEDAVALVREDRPGDRRLVAYVTPAHDEPPTPAQLRTALGAKLPEYMVPAALVVLESLPLNANGKVDRKALPVPEQESEASTFVEPTGPVEPRMAALFAEVLGASRVGALDDFFDLGGHSLLATQLLSRVRREFGVDVPVRTVFETPTVRGLAAAVASAPGSATASEPAALARRPAELAHEAPLSFSQQRLWFLDQLEPGTPLYNVAAALRLEGALDVRALETALKSVVARHESLRTTFGERGGEPFQRIHASLPPELTVLDWRGRPAHEAHAALQEACVSESLRPFELSRGPLVRALLVRMEDTAHVLQLTMHHIVSDGWSMGVLVREVGALYEAEVAGRTAPLPALPLQYADYACWQREHLQGERLAAGLEYWRNRLGGAPRALELPTDRPRPPVQSFRGARHTFALPAELTRALQTLSEREGATLFMTLLAGFQAVLARYSGQDDIVVGSPIANRTRAETEGLIGFFVNTLALRTDLSGDPTFRELLGRVKDSALGAYAHQDVPFEKLVEVLQPQRDPSRSPLFQVMLVLQNNPAATVRAAGLTLHEYEEAGGGSAKFDLLLDMKESGGELRGELEYNTDLFDASTAERLVGHLRTLLEEAVARPETHLGRLSMLTGGERAQLTAWNATRRPLEPLPFIHERVDRQAERTPDAVAVIFQEQQLTYRQLREQSDAVARELRRRGVGPEVTVGLACERSVEGVVGLLGILKAGGAYVPVDPALPQERVSYMLRDAGARLVLTHRPVAPSLPPLEGEVLLLEELREAPGGPFEPPALLPDSSAYVIYTSGSTGRPKGVNISHASVVHSTEARLTAFPSTPRVYLMLAPFSFDPSVCGIFWTLCHGGTLVLPPDALRESTEEIPRLIARHGVTHMSFTPSLYATVLELARPEQLASLELVIVAAEASPPAIVRRHARVLPGAQLFNEYGPTEVTVYASVGWCDPESRAATVPIGKPIANMQVLILDKHLRPVPVGVPGELYLGGLGLARGYWGRPELTAERFVPHPHSDVPGARLYRTGDLGRWLPEGNIEFIGRVDNQVKVRGFRIELGEVEEVLTQHPGVREAVVLAREDTPGLKRLVAYASPREGMTLGAAELRAFLRGRLPEYMVPSAVVVLDALPRTPNDKVDRRALPAPGVETRAELEPPRTPVEQALAGVWKELLGVPEVGRQDNFFELGGHSLLAVRALALARARLGVNVPLRALFESPSLEALARSVEAAGSGEARNGALVALRREGSQRPFFCVHPVGGSVACYRELAGLLGPERPFYALQARGLEGEAPPREHLEEMAAAYVAEVRAVQPRGPYLLGGWSMGGIVALEMAQQLTRAGEEVARVVLLDSYLEALDPAAANVDEASLLAGFLADALEAAGQPVPEKLELPEAEGPEARAEALLRQGEKLGLATVEQGKRLLAVYRANLQALSRYSLQPYAGPVVLMRAEASAPAKARDWAEVIQRGVTVLRVEADHYSMLRPPRVHEVAARVREVLDAVP
ncbi:non-ribosomal peptide synthetase [Cystobacter ferrugineus]|uniref:Carrier domain-containing protein n=1 Tax=Cystobacter ferrugineus TaxID=83449 RepID=A0A1L9B8K3_9BACT|nr:non-ribosomal peptide synthetase [Cystobacter ferrugineus]OJH38589.1 hypothetical protein BON30_20315 [Cystobacter ferrugineus]